MLRFSPLPALLPGFSKCFRSRSQKFALLRETPLCRWAEFLSSFMLLCTLYAPSCSFAVLFTVVESQAFLADHVLLWKNGRTELRQKKILTCFGSSLALKVIFTHSCSQYSVRCHSSREPSDTDNRELAFDVRFYFFFAYVIWDSGYHSCNRRKMSWHVALKARSLEVSSFLVERLHQLVCLHETVHENQNLVTPILHVRHMSSIFGHSSDYRSQEKFVYNPLGSATRLRSCTARCLGWCM